MRKADIDIEPCYFDTYLNKVPDVTWQEALDQFGPQLFEAEYDHLMALEDRVYAPGKWTVKQMMQHLIDAERVFQYRALRFARRDNTVLSPFDENAYADVADVNDRTIGSLIGEYQLLRHGGMAMFRSFTREDMLAKGRTPSAELSVLSMAFIMAGHAIHHMEIIRERYYPMLMS
ncbi:MAG: DinB family protein [Saprospiraceae bacterium]|nr:DinB family protein [Saprospiraceae bacterium]